MAAKLVKDQMAASTLGPTSSWGRWAYAAGSILDAILVSGTKYEWALVGGSRLCDLTVVLTSLDLRRGGPQADLINGATKALMRPSNTDTTAFWTGGE